VLVNGAPDAPILRDEIFGPVAPVVTFESEDEAIDRPLRAGFLRIHQRSMAGAAWSG
jgi:acyl-CoA reductase-like NAD-dependent aldehyde dehydrogenase